MAPIKLATLKKYNLQKISKKKQDNKITVIICILTQERLKNVNVKPTLDIKT